MRSTLIGSGYVGLVTGTCLAGLGNIVGRLDLDVAKIDLLNSGGEPIYEPRLKGIIDRNCGAGRLRFTTGWAAAVAHGDVQFIAVGGPPGEDGSAGPQCVLASVRGIGRTTKGSKVIVDESVGTAAKVREAIDAQMVARGFDADPTSLGAVPQGSRGSPWCRTRSSRRRELRLRTSCGPIASSWGSTALRLARMRAP